MGFPDNLPDNYDLWCQHEDEMEEALERYPICDCCKERITDEKLWDIDGDLICKECMEENYERDTENYMK